MVLGLTQPSPGPPSPPGYKVTLVLAALVFVSCSVLPVYLDVLFLLLLLLCSPVMVIRALLAWKNRPLMLRRFASIGIYCLAVLAWFGLETLDASRVEKNPQRVAAAVEAYKKQRGTYPAKLEQLVPDFLPAIPPAQKEGLFYNLRFQYSFPETPGFSTTNDPPDLHYDLWQSHTWYDFSNRQWNVMN